MADYKITGEASLDTSKAEASMETLGKTAKSVSDNIVKETAPRPGVPRALSDDTVADIRDLFGLIAEREAELAEEAGVAFFFEQKI